MLSSASSEQSKFEEEFKYLIVTSSLFNETSDQQQNTNTVNSSINIEDSSALTAQLFYASTLWFIFCVSMIGWNTAWVACISLAYIILCFFLYKHHVTIAEYKEKNVYINAKFVYI